MQVKKDIPHFNAFLNELSNALAEQLPGISAQAKLAPPHRPVELRTAFPGDQIRDSAVLILLWQVSQQIFTVFVLRTEYEGFHSNQIAFPGGKYELSDADIVATALREAQEEVGIIPETITILGQLTPLLIPLSRFMVYPIVGFTRTAPAFIMDPKEIKKILPCNLFDFLKPDHYAIENIEVRGKIITDIPCFKIGEHLVWGATAMILNELLEIIKNKYAP